MTHSSWSEMISSELNLVFEIQDLAYCFVYISREGQLAFEYNMTTKRGIKPADMLQSLCIKSLCMNVLYKCYM